MSSSDFSCQNAAVRGCGDGLRRVACGDGPLPGFDARDVIGKVAGPGGGEGKVGGAARRGVDEDRGDLADDRARHDGVRDRTRGLSRRRLIAVADVHDVQHDIVGFPGRGLDLRASPVPVVLAVLRDDLSAADVVVVPDAADLRARAILQA